MTIGNSYIIGNLSGIYFVMLCMLSTEDSLNKIERFEAIINEII